MSITNNRNIFLESRPDFDFESNGVFNPTCIEKDGFVHMFYRAVGKDNISTIAYCQIKDDRIVKRSDRPIISPEYKYESRGVEDPRITFIDGKYYLFYTAYDGTNALVAYATSSDLVTFSKQGLITPQISYDEAEDIFRGSGTIEKYSYFEKLYREYHGNSVYLWEKDVALFPKKINGQYALIHRILPGIQILYFNNFAQLTQDFWRQYLKNLNNFVVLDPKYPFESSFVGGGAVPIETDAGWLLIYHSVHDDITKGLTYHACAALLDKNNPTKVIGRLKTPLFSPTYEWEKKGIVNNVVFPTGAIVKNDSLSIYYGAADSRVGLATFSLSRLLEELL